MADTSRIREHMEVVGSDGGHVGTVDHMEGSDRIKLTRTDRDAGGQHHFIPTNWVSDVGQQVRLNLAAADAKQRWASGSGRPSGPTGSHR